MAHYIPKKLQLSGISKMSRSRSEIHHGRRNECFGGGGRVLGGNEPSIAINWYYFLGAGIISCSYLFGMSTESFVRVLIRVVV